MTSSFSARALVLVFLLPAVAGAGTIFTNLGTDPGYDTSSGQFVGNGQDLSGNTYGEADTFTPTTTATLTDLKLALSCFSSGLCTDTVTVTLNADSGSDTPGSLIEGFTVAGSSLGLKGNANPLVMLTSELNPALNAETQYWIVVTAPSTSYVVWNLNNTTDPSDQSVSFDGGGSWYDLGGTPSAYQVDGTVPSSGTPEPSTIALFAGSVAFLGLVRRRAKRTA